jgi:hypothetical protein
MAFKVPVGVTTDRQSDHRIPSSDLLQPRLGTNFTVGFCFNPLTLHNTSAVEFVPGILNAASFKGHIP